MANKLSFSLQVDGAEQSAQKIKNVAGAVDILQGKVGKTGQKVTDFISGFPPHIQADVLRQLGARPPGAAPPIPTTGGGVNWRMAGLGAAASLLSPWVGARGLSSSGVFGGGGAGGGGSLFFGQGGFGGFLQAFIAITAVTHALRSAFEQLKEAVNRGAQLFTKSAGLATSTDLFAHIQKTLTAVGLPNAAERLLAMGQFSTGNKIRGNDIGGVLLGASRGFQSREDIQAILNLSKDITDAWNRTAIAAQASSMVAYQLFRTQLDFSTLKTNWHSLMEEIASISTIIVRPFLRFAEVMTQVAEIHFGLLAKGLQAVGLISTGPTDFKKFGLGPGTLAGRPESGWEKMGLIISGGIGGTDYARQTAANTKRIADALSGKNSDIVPYGMPSMAPFHLP